MSQFNQIKARVRKDLGDKGITYFSDTDLNESFEDAYADIISLTQCIIKKTQVNFTTDVYYDFKALGVSDFMAVTAIFNNNTNRWMFDDKTLRDFDLIRDNWEMWNGTPWYWSSVNHQWTAIVPHYSEIPNLPFDLYYWASAPTINDEDTPLIANDMQSLLEFYTLGDLLEQAEEFKKASNYFKKYYENVETYAERVKNLAKRDLLRLA